MSKYTVTLKLELEDDHGIPFNKELLKYILGLDLVDSHLAEAYCVSQVDIDKIESSEDVYAATRVQ